MSSLYTFTEVETLSRRKAGCRLWALILSAVTLSVCAALCFLVRTGNAGKLQLIITGIFILGGWSVILLLRLGYFPAKALKAHCEGILSGESEQLQGVLHITDQRIRIPKSIVARRVTLHSGDTEISLNVEDSRADRIPTSDMPVRMTVVRKFITSVEVPREEA